MPTVSAVSLAEFAGTHSVALTRFAYVLCGDRGLAEDLVQDTFVALHRRFGELLTIDAPVAYARRAIVNGHISHRRRRASAVTILAELPDVAVDGGFSDEQNAMWQVLGTLPDRQRAVLVMRYYLDLPDVEIAAALDARVGTIRSLAARAFATLRSHPVLTAEESR